MIRSGKLSRINELSELQRFVNSCHPQISKRGGRVFSTGSETVKLNAMLKKLERLAKKDTSQPETVREIARKIRWLDHQEVNYRSKFVRLSTNFRRFCGNLGYNREKVLDKLQFPGRTPVTSRGKWRYLPLKGTTGTVGCKVYGLSAKTFPRISPKGRIECATRTIARLNNLIAVRGERAGARMIGPGAYYGNVEQPHKYGFTIDIDDYGVPTFFRHDKRAIAANSRELDGDFGGKSVEINATWHSGKGNSIEAVKNKYSTAFGGSLFPDSGILEVDRAAVDLPYFDPTAVDLSSFKARLVKNDVPFQLVKEKLAAKDEFRPVSYYFDSNYALEETLHGGGVFIEVHEGFSQTMTPLDERAGGFVILGRWKDESRSRLELIGIKIPFGYTLIIDKGCIHGDATLTGYYAMAMTSNHKTMQTADTVFIKDQHTCRNLVVTMESAPPPVISNPTHIAGQPVAHFGHNAEAFYNRLNAGLPYNPTTRIFNPVQ